MDFTPKDFDEGIAIVDIGAEKMMINITYKGSIVFSKVKNRGGSALTKMLKEHLNIDHDKAEKIKIDHNWTDETDLAVVKPFIGEIINDLRFELRMFTSIPDNIKLKKIILTGGALFPELVKEIENELALKVEVANPFLGFNYKSQADKKLLQKNPSKYMLSLGLALRILSNV